MSAATITLRPVVDADSDFLRRLYFSVRADEPGIGDLPEATRELLLAQQFDIQTRAYRAAFPSGEFSLVLVDDEPAGRLSIDRRTDALHIIDIALLPRHRGKGVGSALIRELQADAGREGRSVTLHTHPFRVDAAFYRRLGFEEESRLDTGEAFLRWRPAPQG